MNQTTQTATTKEALEPCPFCGSAAHLRSEIVDGRTKEKRYVYFVACQASYTKNCPLFTRAMTKRSAEIEAITDWNTRRVSAPIVAPPNYALVQLLEAALLHPESAEGNIRQVIEALSGAAPIAPVVDHRLIGVLISIQFADTGCNCKHNDANCCAVAGEFCARCWAHAALEGRCPETYLSPGLAVSKTLFNELLVAFDSTRMGEKGVNQGCWCVQSPTNTNQPDWKHGNDCKQNMALLSRCESAAAPASTVAPQQSESDTCICGHSRWDHWGWGNFACSHGDCAKFMTPASSAAPTHRCNGVNRGARHGTANRCTVCGEYREGWYDSNGMEVRAPVALGDEVLDARKVAIEILEWLNFDTSLDAVSADIYGVQEIIERCFSAESKKEK